MLLLTLTTKTVKGVGTFGRLFYQGQQIAVSVECDWNDNKRNVSCVPAGRYELRWIDSPKYGKRLHMHNPDLGVTPAGASQRTHCMIHPANFPHELQGCIALGNSWHPTQWGVSDSRSAVADVEALCSRHAQIELEVIRL
ncbi:DUF5675 family protein [Shewanella submarina]|uniref:DUF5675 family protein n=1 Tax=Shewanella submarina TaxID=2016376 RepID=A0ABV7G5C1_9GAMM|nr:DUF5675 family protein [Shewanella submarina]MCL1038359.1 DUF5675 family protein [Shewanella submarina]